MNIPKVSTSDMLPLPVFLVCREIEQYPKPLVIQSRACIYKLDRAPQGNLLIRSLTR